MKSFIKRIYKKNEKNVMGEVLSTFFSVWDKLISMSVFVGWRKQVHISLDKVRHLDMKRLWNFLMLLLNGDQKSLNNLLTSLWIVPDRVLSSAYFHLLFLPHSLFLSLTLSSYIWQWLAAGLGVIKPKRAHLWLPLGGNKRRAPWLPYLC